MGWGKSVNWNIIRSLKHTFGSGLGNWIIWHISQRAQLYRDFDWHLQEPTGDYVAWHPTTAQCFADFIYKDVTVADRHAKDMKNFRVSADLRVKDTIEVWCYFFIGFPVDREKPLEGDDNRNSPWRYRFHIAWDIPTGTFAARLYQCINYEERLVGSRQLTNQTSVWWTLGAEFIDGEIIFYASNVAGKQKFDADFQEVYREPVPNEMKGYSDVYLGFQFSGTAVSTSNYIGGDNLWLEEASYPEVSLLPGPYYEENLKIPEFPMLFLPEMNLDKANLTLRQIWENLNAIEGIAGNFHQGRSSLGPTHWRYVDENGEQIHGIGEV